MGAKAMNITAMALFGTLSIFVRGVALGSLETAFWRGVIAMAVLLLLRLVTPKSDIPSLTRRQKLALLLSGMALGLDWSLLFTAYRYTSVASATLAYYFAPVLVMILSPILFRERASRLQILCFLAATVGLALVIAGGGAGVGSLVGIGCALAAACFYVCVILINKLCPGGSSLDRTLWQFAGAIALLLVLVPLRGGFGILHCSLVSLGNLLVLGVVHTGLAFWLYFTSIRSLPGQETAILSYIDPLVAIGISALVLRETVGPLQWAGAALILGFTALYQWSDARQGVKK